MKKKSENTIKVEDKLLDSEVAETKKVEKKKIKTTKKKPDKNKIIKETVKNDKNKKVKKAKKNKKGKTQIDKKDIIRLNPDFKEGLTTLEVTQREEYGLSNENNVKTTKSNIRIFVNNTCTFFNFLYLAITILLVIANSWTNMVFIVIVIANTTLGIVQELKAKQMTEKLSLLVASKALVVRDGKEKVIPTEEVVLDDIIILRNGNQVYTDCIVVEGNTEVDESNITGESEAVFKKEGSLLYSGSFISSGSIYAKVEHVGKDNYIETLASEAKKKKQNSSELLKTLNIIVKVVGIIIIPLFILQFMRTYGAPYVWDYDRYCTTISRVTGSVIGMIPAGLFLLTSIALYVGVYRLGKKHNTLVHELYGIETLARVDMLCLDKTGTITDGTMRVIDCIEIKNPTEFTMREIVGSMMNSFNDSNATSEAMIRFFSKNNVLKATDILPFSSKRKYSAVSFDSVGTFYLGAPEFVLENDYSKVKSKVEKYASKGCRVLAVAYTPSAIKRKGITKSAKAVALIVLEDHVKEDAYDTIEYFRHNDVAIRVISGDNPITVSKIAERVGIKNSNRYISLEGLTDEEVREVALDYTIFGRVTPEQKKILVQTFKANKHTVAMTGDGVNDILALKEADCSIAMASGSEATRNVANIVLLDSNFSSMPAIVSEGRRVINNIQRTSTLYLSKTLFILFITIFYLALGQIYPFEPSQQTVMIELLAIGLPSWVISFLPNKERVKGNFLTNVLKTSIPGGLTVLIFHVVTWLMCYQVHLSWLPSLSGWSEEVYITVVLLISTAVSICVLNYVSKPYNILKRVVFFVILISTLLLVVLSSKIDFLDQFLKIIWPLDESVLLYTILCFFVVNPVYMSMHKLLGKITKVSELK